MAVVFWALLCVDERFSVETECLVLAKHHDLHFIADLIVSSQYPKYLEVEETGHLMNTETGTEKLTECIRKLPC